MVYNDGVAEWLIVLHLLVFTVGAVATSSKLAIAIVNLPYSL